MPLCARVPFAFFVLATACAIGLTAGAQNAASCAGPYDCALEQVQRHDFAPAIATLEQLAARTPADLKVLNLLGIALTGAGRTDAANARFRAALRIDPKFSPALRNLAVNEFRTGRASEARRHFEAVLRLSPDDEIAHEHLAEIGFQRRQYRSALAHYEKSRTRVARDPGLLLHHATSLLEEQRTSEALALLERLPADAADRLFEAGVVVARHESHAQAARFFAAARRAGYKDGYVAGYNQVLSLIAAGSNEAAIHAAQELFAEGRRDAELYNLVSRAYVRTNRIKDAYDALREATRVAPSVDDHYIDLAMLCLEHENYDLALEIVDIGLTHQPESALLHLQRGVVLAMSGSTEKAEQAFTRASKAAPDQPSPFVALSMIWMQRGQTPRAVDLLRTRTRAVTAPSPPEAVMFYALGIALLRAGAAPDDAEGTEALAAFRTAVRLQPAFAQAQSECGKLLLKRGDVFGAIAHLERAAALDPQNAAPAYLLAQAYRRAGETERARDLLARVSRLNAQERGDDPNSDLKPLMFRIVRDSSPPAAVLPTSMPSGPGEAVAAATACAAAGDLDGAIVRLRQLVQAAPQDSEIRYQLAVTLWNRYQWNTGRRQVRDLDDAVETLSVAIKAAPDRARFHLVLGQLLAERQHVPRAVEHLRKAVALEPQSGDAHYNLGLALRLAGDLAAAADQFRAALALDENHSLARRSLGLVLRQQGDLKAAVSELQRAAADAPDDPQGHALLGAALLRGGSPAAAIVELREALRLQPSITEARVNLAQALMKSGQKDEALVHQAEVRRVNEEKADFGRALVLLDASTARLANGDVPGAIAQRREAIAISPGFAEAHYELGRALSETGDSDADAEKAFREAIRIEPAHVLAHRALADLLERRGDTGSARDIRARARAIAPCS